MKTLTVSELIKAIPAKTEQLWVEGLLSDLYQGGFRQEDWDPDGENISSLEQTLRWAFEHALRTLYQFVPVQVNDDPEDED